MTIEYQFNTLVELLEHRVKFDSADIAFSFIDDNGEINSITYYQLASRTKDIASHLIKKTCNGDRAILLYPPGLDLIISYLACLYAGVIAVPIYPPVNENLVKKTQNIIIDCEPKIILSTKTIANKILGLKIIKNGLKTPIASLLVNRYFSKEQSLTHWDFDKVDWLVTDKIQRLKKVDLPLITSDSIAFLQYTSGSTGYPKGVVLTHENLLDNLRIIKNLSGATKESVGVFWIPPYHDLGLIGGILSPIYAGGICYLMSPISFIKKPLLWLETISKYRGTITAAPNFAFDYCIRKISDNKKRTLNLSSLEFLFNGAEPIKGKSLEAFYTKFRSTGLKYLCMSPGYGLAESTLTVSGTPFDDLLQEIYIDKKALEKNKIAHVNRSEKNAYSIVSCGQVHQEVHVVDPETCIKLKPMQVGEIWVHGKSVAHGYWGKPQQTQEAFHARIANETENVDKTYLRTGDLGFFDENNQLYITGRIKDLLIIQGRNIYPQDVEAALDTCHPDIRQGCCAVFSDTNCEIIVCVEVSDRYSKINKKSLIKEIQKAVITATGTIPICINLLQPKTIFKTTSGKIQRSKTKNAHFENKLELIESVHRHEDIESNSDFLIRLNNTPQENRQSLLKLTLTNIILSQLDNENSDTIDENMGFFDLGFDSVMIVQLWHQLQCLVGEKHILSQTVLFEHSCIAKLAAFLQKEVFPQYFNQPSDDQRLLESLESLLEESFHPGIKYDFNRTTKNRCAKKIIAKNNRTQA